MKKVKKALSNILVIAVLCSNTIGVNVKASEEKKEYWGNSSVQKGISKEFYYASDNTIVCYMEGEPIYKKDIKSSGMVSEEKIRLIENKFAEEQSKNMSRSKTTKKATYNTLIIPQKYNNAIVKTITSTKGYSQYTTKYFFTRSKGAKLADAIQNKSINALVALLAGFIKKVGGPASVLITLDSAYKNSVASNIRKYTNNNNKVQVNECKSKYGTFYGVFKWKNRTIQTTLKLNKQQGTDTLKVLQYK